MDIQPASLPEDILNDLCSRFLINVPMEAKVDLIRVCFQIELAYWFYIDFYRTERPELPSCSINSFASAIFRHCPFLTEHAGIVGTIIDDWKAYKRSVPTYGAIIFDQSLEHVLLVKGFWSKATWSFPKGKINKDEPPHECAIREVLEETGFDISPLINEKEYAEKEVSEQTVRLYFVSGVSLDTKFQPKTRGEIKEVQWFHIDDLPTHKKDNAPRINLKLSPNNFYMAMAFMKPLRKWRAKKMGIVELFDEDSSRGSSRRSSGQGGIYYQEDKLKGGSYPSAKSLQTVSDMAESDAVLSEPGAPPGGYQGGAQGGAQATAATSSLQQQQYSLQNQTNMAFAQLMSLESKYGSGQRSGQGNGFGRSATLKQTGKNAPMTEIHGNTQRKNSRNQQQVTNTKNQQPPEIRITSDIFENFKFDWKAIMN